MKLTWTGNFVAPWTNWSVYRGSVEEKMCRRPSTLIWREGDNIFCETKPRSALFSAYFFHRASLVNAVPHQAHFLACLCSGRRNRSGSRRKIGPVAYMIGYSRAAPASVNRIPGGGRDQVPPRQFHRGTDGHKLPRRASRGRVILSNQAHGILTPICDRPSRRPTSALPNRRSHSLQQLLNEQRTLVDLLDGRFDFLRHAIG
jgi:hypothetical protein